MTFKLKLFTSALLVILVVSVGVYALNNRQQSYNRTSKTYVVGVSPEVDQAVANAKQIYSQKRELKIDFSSGPCLTNDLMPGWVADTVHNPRQTIDDQPENQCQAYTEGRAKHFVELDLQGNLVRVH